MTATDRAALIERTFREAERQLCYAPFNELVEVTMTTLAIVRGLTVTPDEVTRTLAQAAGFAP